MLNMVLSQASRADVYTVTNTNPDGEGSLSWAVDQANSHEYGDTINFAIDPGALSTIFPTAPLVLTDPGTIIDGYTQSGASPNTNPAGQALNGELKISVSGQNIVRTDTDVAVFHIKTNQVTLRGLNIHTGPVFGVAIEASGGVAAWGNRVQGCLIGTDITGTQARPNKAGLNESTPYSAGVVFIGATTNILGIDRDEDSPSPAQRNLISGLSAQDFTGTGVLLLTNGTAVSNNYVAGNLIGTTMNAAGALGNQHGIVFLGNSMSNILNGNVISGNLGHGVYAQVASHLTDQPNSSNSLQSNLIGINPESGQALANGQDGIHLGRGSQAFTIGTASIHDRNVISGNHGYGLYIHGDGTADSHTNLVTYNFIGLSNDGLAAVPNQKDGIRIANTADKNTIGGTDTPNFISGNSSYGITLIDASKTIVRDNVIGLDFDQTKFIPNQSGGIALLCTPEEICCQESTIDENTISGNQGPGITILGKTHGSNGLGPNNTIENNLGSGVYGNLANATNSVQTNFIAKNQSHGIELHGSSMQVTKNNINENWGWGIVCYPDYGADSSPESADDDTLSLPNIYNNFSINDNLLGGILGLDTPLPGGKALATDNTIDSADKLQVLQLWYAAVEILDHEFHPIESGDYLITLQSEIGTLVQGDDPNGGLWGPGGWSRSNVSSWFQTAEYLITSDQTLHLSANHTITVTGANGGSADYSFDGIDNDGSDLGGQPAGILTAGSFRYQLAEVVVKPDSDEDGVADEVDCAPSDATYHGAEGINPCDADQDGYCFVGITGLVRAEACTHDLCFLGLCVPTDCDDGADSIHPGVSEKGDTLCDDSLDNDCDGLVDEDDPQCVECSQNEDCDDLNSCNGAETCLDGACQVLPVACDDKNTCTIDVCDSVSGCFFIPFNGSCDDGQYCTIGENCHDGLCQGGSPRDCSHLNDDCNTGVCDEMLDQCVKHPVDDGVACDDQNACTQTDRCQSGACFGSNPIVCTPLDQCHEPGSCDPASGQCSNPVKPDGSQCDDGDACTMKDVCDQGTCQGVALDQDEDGVIAMSCGGNDCNDNNQNIKPGAKEICNDGIDNDCDGLTDTIDENDCSGKDGGCNCTSAPASVPTALWSLITALAIVMRTRRLW